MCLSPISAVIAAQVFRAPIDVGEQPQKIKTPKAEMRLGRSFLLLFFFFPHCRKNHANDPERRNVSGMMRNISNNLPYLAVSAAGTSCSLEAKVFQACCFQAANNSAD